MTREYFLFVLMDKLKELPPEERNEIYRYYLEYFEDRDVGAGENIPPDMDSPELIAENILRAQGFEQKGGPQAQEGPEAASWESPGAEIPEGSFDSVDVSLSIGSIEIRTADIPRAKLIEPKNKFGQEIDYKLIWEIRDRHFILQDRFRRNISSKYKRMQNDPVVLLLPEKLKLQDVALDLSLGSARISGLRCRNMKIDNDLGSLNMNDSVVEDLSVNLAMGSINLNKVELFGSRMDTQMGSLKGEAILHGKHLISCALGSVNLKLDQEKQRTSVRAKVDFGSFKVNGEPAEVFTSPVMPDAELDLSATVGGITLKFTR